MSIEHPHPDLVADPTAGEEAAPEIHADAAAVRAEEIALLRRKVDGISVFLAGPSNVVLQLAWPEVGYGVVESKVDSGKVTQHPFKRFRTTIGYLSIALLGSDEQRTAFRKAIDGQHRQVRSTPDSPVKYNAFNRDLQLWVASCIYYGTIDIFTRMHGPLTPHEEAVVLRAGARIGTTLQVHPDDWHQTPADFWRYWEEGLARCHIDDRVGSYLVSLMKVEIMPKPVARLAGPANLWFNNGFLPQSIRDQLGLSWSDADQRRHDRILRGLGRVTRRAPHVVRAFPMNAMAWNLEVRRRLGRPMV
ncbi:hypothetical protein DJ010_18975 [Nocardioides silvaticus]|uniref:ER-bound oxygenase mpaB/mpaB'/Rubber oxygenase catalytic domain-containing protein n=1 Tax=Nocardioides silvaticus TaxID=2201891 RepID=A0A316TCL7_9ACTN|nr:oxygenase MpaB family protein [Nocardioides silvaticus]PWN01251.1 hypothetical protein DJ010_18975 [Nocardioides silvaticus]